MKGLLLILAFALFTVSLSSFADAGWQNMSDGFKIASLSYASSVETNGSDFWILDRYGGTDGWIYHYDRYGNLMPTGGGDYGSIGSSQTASNVEGLTTNGTDFWLVSNSGAGVYHINWLMQNQSDGFNTQYSGIDYPYGITTNVTAGGILTDLWLCGAEGFIYHFNSAGVNLTDGFNISRYGARCYDLAMNGSDFWVLDSSDMFIYHFDRAGNNLSDGFDAKEFGISDGYTQAITINPNGEISDIWIPDKNDRWMYHLKNLGSEFYNTSSCRNITEPGTYKLNKSITDWNGEGACINITTSDVELNCIDWSMWIDGRDTFWTSGIKSEGLATGKLTNVSIKNCNVTDWYYGDYHLRTENSTLTNINTLSNSQRGIYLVSSSNNILSYINTLNNYGYGIISVYSSLNTFSNINASGNSYGISVGGMIGTNSNNILSNITASGNSDFGIVLDFAINNTLTNINASGNSRYGILLVSSDKNQIFNSTIQSNKQYGIYFYYSRFNNITGNRIENNSVSGYAGIYLESHASTATSNSSYNLIWNNIINNTPNGGRNWMTYGINYTNYFNITQTAGTNILGGNWIGGNYWSDYTGSDGNGDGIGDMVYVINETYMKDYLPLYSLGGIPTLQTLKWRRVSVTYSSSTKQKRIYVDGSLVRTDTLSGLGNYKINNPAGNLYISKHPTMAGISFNGTVDEVGIYSRAMSGNEIASGFMASTLYAAMPIQNEEKTFVINADNITEVTIAPVIRVGSKERNCGVTAKIRIPLCSQK